MLMNYHNKILYLVQGDDEHLYITVLQPDGEKYTMTNKDRLKFTIKSAIDSVNGVHVWGAKGENTFVLTRGVTSLVPLGQCVYEIKLYQWASEAPDNPDADNAPTPLKVYTIIPASTLICHPSIG